MITNLQLRETLVGAQLQFYFECKLAPLPKSEVLTRIEETLKFLLLASHGGGDIPVSKEIDEIWHLWILETMEYRRLCERLPGTSFLHHSSNDYVLFRDPAAKDRKIDRTAGIATLGSYVMNYGAFASERLRYWPLAERLASLFGGNVDRLNAWLRCASALVPARELA